VFQVESPLAVENAAEIAALDGVDVLFVSPTDLSHAMGIPDASTSRRSAGPCGP
jgi:2-keto-3-deoxy-L-rhamnonate aldolase RhmA